MFVADCQAAVNGADPVGSVSEVIAETIRHGASIDAALGTRIGREPDTFFSSDRLTVQRILWPGGSWSEPHEHRMWAVIGVYAGEELNQLFERECDGRLRESRTCAVSTREVLAFGPAAIHSVENPHRDLTAGLHVYGGDINGIDRSAWSPSGREVPLSENRSRQMAMFRVIRDLARERGDRFDSDARYVVMQALRAECERERRYLTPEEARPIAEHALSATR
jgi:predicted metal-dependent enzyme (double-stranded beta helix superfamily)